MADVPKVEEGVYMRTVQGGIIKALFDSLKDLVHDVTFRVDATGVKMLTLDDSKCALVHLKLRADAFENFVCEPPTATYDLCVNVGNMFTLIKSTGNKDVVSMAYDAKGNVHMLEIAIQNSEQRSNTTYLLKLLDLNSTVRELNKAEVRSTISMPSPLEASSSAHIASAQARAISSGDRAALTFTRSSRRDVYP